MLKKKETDLEKFDRESRERKERIAKRDLARKREEEKNRPKPKTPGEIKKEREEEFEKSVEDLKARPPRAYTKEEIIKNFVDNRDDRRVYFDLARNQPTMNSKIRERLEMVAGDESKVRYILKKMKIMGIAKEEMVLYAWIKDYCNKNFKGNLKAQIKISAEEKKMLQKIKWAETKSERSRNSNIAVSGFWFLTDLGKALLPEIKGACL